MLFYLYLNLLYKFNDILYQMNLAIFSYGSIHPHWILSFIFWHDYEDYEDTIPDHQTRIYVLKITESLYTAAVQK